MDNATPNIMTEQVTTVALKVEPEWRPLLYFIQARANEVGGCRNLAMELIRNYRGHIGPSELHLARHEKRRLTPGEWASAAAKLNLTVGGCDFDRHYLFEDTETTERRIAREKEERAEWLAYYKAQSEAPTAIDQLHAVAIELAESKLSAALHQICTEGPDSIYRRIRLDGPDLDVLNWFPSLVECLRDYCDKYQGPNRYAETSIRQSVDAALDDAWANKGFALIHGNARLGKSTAAKAWVEANQDKARYFSMEAGSSVPSFFREMAIALGCSVFSYQSRNEEVVAQALQGGNLMLVIDEAHLLMGTGQKTNMGRLEWLRTALINKGVPVALLTTPQFVQRINQAGEQTGFNIDQLRGRITNPVILPESLPIEDFFAVAQVLAPQATKKQIQYLAGYGMDSRFYFQAISRAVQEAQRLAKGELWESFIEKAIVRCVELDNTFNTSFATKEKPTRKKKPKQSFSIPAAPQQEACRQPAERPQHTNFMPDRARPVAIPQT